MTDMPSRRPGRSLKVEGPRSVAAEQISGIVVTGDYSSIDAREIHLEPGAMPLPSEVSAPQGTHNLPRRPAGVFVGRDADVTKLAAALESGVGVVTEAI